MPPMDILSTLNGEVGQVVLDLRLFGAFEVQQRLYSSSSTYCLLIQPPSIADIHLKSLK